MSGFEISTIKYVSLKSSIDLDFNQSSLLLNGTGWHFLPFVLSLISSIDGSALTTIDFLVRLFFKKYADIGSRQALPLPTAADFSDFQLISHLTKPSGFVTAAEVCS
jgi:hypothetical protein